MRLSEERKEQMIKAFGICWGILFSIVLALPILSTWGRGSAFIFEEYVFVYLGMNAILWFTCYIVYSNYLWK